MSDCAMRSPFAILETSSQQRLIAPEEVAAAVLRLCATDVNGETILLEGN